MSKYFATSKCGLRSIYIYVLHIRRKSEEPEDLRLNLEELSEEVFTRVLFEYVYVLDVPEDPEDFLILYISLI